MTEKIGKLSSTTKKYSRSGFPLSGILSGVLITFLLMFSSPGMSRQNDDKAWDFTLQDQHGKMVTLSSLKGKFIHLEFSAGWCGPCRSQAGYMSQAEKELKKYNFISLTLLGDADKSEAMQWAKKYNLDHVLVANSYVQSAYRVNSIPTNVIIRPDMTIAGSWAGAPSGKSGFIRKVRTIVPEMFDGQEEPHTITAENGLHASYYSSDRRVTRVTDENIDFDWGFNEPIAGVGAKDFLVVWTGRVQPPLSGEFTFYTRADSGVNLYVNDQLLIHRWRYEGVREHSATISLEAGKFYKIRLVYRHDSGHAGVRLLWSHNELTKQIIPAERLFKSAP